MAAARPQLRGLLSSSLKKHAVACFGISIVATIAAKFWLKDARIQKYEEFYKHYDAQKDFERMRDAGVFRSVQPAK